MPFTGINTGEPPATTSSGMRMPFGAYLAPGAIVAAYVRSTGAQPGDDPILAKNGAIVPDLNTALGRCRSGFGDVVIVLPGHVENISSANQLSNLVAGTQIIGVGYARFRPTLTWTTATSTILLNKDNVRLSNFTLNMDPGSGVVTVAAPITVSGVGVMIDNCYIRTSTDANSLTTIPITTTAAATYFHFVNNRVFGATAGECTTVLRLVGASFARILGNIIEAATSSAAIGVVQFLTTASTSVDFEDNTFINRKAASSQALTGLAGVTGICRRDFHIILDNLTTGVVTPADLRFQDCRVSNFTGEAGMLMTVVST